MSEPSMRDIYTSRCTCSGGTCLGKACQFCGAFDDPCPQTGAAGPRGRWESAPPSDDKADYAGFRITELWAWTQVGDDDEEGIIAFMNGPTWVPLIASDRVRLDAMRPQAALTAKITGRPVKLSRFTQRIDLEEIAPG